MTFPDFTKIASSTNYGSRRDKSSIKYIVLHYTGATGQTAGDNLIYFTGKYRKASAHYFIGRDGIGQSVPDDFIAWHCGTETGFYTHPYCRNSNSIGIEICFDYIDGEWVISDAVYTKVIYLVSELMSKYNIPETNILRHYDVTGKICPEPWVENTSKWQQFKQDLKVGYAVVRYKNFNEIPDYFKSEFKPLLQAFSDVNDLDLSYDMLRILILTKRYIDIVMTK